jgi:uncharacterized SAM-binding protein YcdF (DUF218 family)
MPHFLIGDANIVSVQAVATNLLLPPLLLVLLTIACLAIATRMRRVALGIIGLAAVGQLLLATPLIAGYLKTSLERRILMEDRPSPDISPSAIIILGAEAARPQDGIDPGPLSLERLRAGARKAHELSLPVLVTGGPLAVSDPAIAIIMAEVLVHDFGLTARWIEPAARDTGENALLSARLLREAGIASAYLVTHAWHMPRAMEAFARIGFPVVPAPVRFSRVPDGRLSDWIPRPDHLAESWFMLREWAGILVYRLRDGPVPAPQPRQ